MKPITVGELVESLKGLDQTLPVIYTNDGCGMADGETPVTSVSTVETEDWFSDNATGQKVKVVHLNCP